MAELVRLQTNINEARTPGKQCLCLYSDVQGSAEEPYPEMLICSQIGNQKFVKLTPFCIIRTAKDMQKAAEDTRFRSGRRTGRRYKRKLCLEVGKEYDIIYFDI